MIFSRGRGANNNIRFALGRHLIYAEGTKTELSYANNIKKRLDNNPNITPRNDGIIVRRFPRGYATTELLKKVEQDVVEQRNSGKRIDYIWIFFDKDSFSDFDETCKIIYGKNKFKNCEKHVDGEDCDEFGAKWMCCWSNECFEIWIYFHFENLSTPLNRKDYIPRINKFISERGFKGTYEKNLSNLYDFIEKNGGNVDMAVKLARSKDDGSYSNPSTGVYKFIEFFKEYLK